MPVPALVAQDVASLEPTVERVSLDEVIQSVVSDRNRLQWLFEWANDKQVEFDTAMSNTARLGEYARFHYIVDFDVLRRYVEGHWDADQSTLALKFLFEESRVPYFLAPGGFLELIEWLGRDDVGLSELEPSARQAPFAEALAEGIEVDQHDLVDELVVSLKHRNVDQIERLIGVLTDERCRGITSNYDGNDADELEELVAYIPRPRFDADSLPRTKVDRRDAINLAVAVKSVREYRSAKQKSGISVGVLVTRTEGLTGLGRELQRLGSRVSTLINKLARMLIEKNHMVGVGIPAFTPEHVFIAEILGVHENRRQARLHARAFRATFAAVADWCWQRLEVPPESDDLDRPWSTYQLNKLRGHFEKIEGLLQATNSFLYRIEAGQATELSVAAAQRRVRRQEFTHRERLRMDAGAVFRLARDLVAALENLDGFGYELERSTIPNTAIDEIRVLQTPGMYGRIELMSGELYRERSERVEGSRMFVLRWPIFGDELDLIQFLDNAFRFANVSGGAPGMPAELRLNEVTEGSEIWSEGLVIATSWGTFGATIRQVGILGTWDCLQLDTLTDFMPPSGAGSAREILQIRINTLRADYVYDVLPQENSRRRFFTVISHENVTAKILAAYRFLGSQYVVFPLLRKELGSIIADHLGLSVEVERSG